MWSSWIADISKNTVEWAYFAHYKALAYTINVPISGDKRTYDSFGEYFKDLLGLAVNIASALAIIVIIYGGFKYVTSGGDDAKAKEGKDIIVGALIGLALLFLIRVIAPLLGVPTG